MATSELYLRGSLFVVWAGSGRYLLIHPGSGTATPTDKLGAWAADRLIRGYSVAAVRTLLALATTEVDQRFDLFVDALRQLGALGAEPPHIRSHWRARMLISLLLGPCCSFFSFILPLLPAGVLAWVYGVLPRLPLARKNIGQTIAYTDRNLRSAGYENTSAEWRTGIAVAASNAITRTYVFLYLSIILPGPKLTKLLDRIVQPEQFAALDRALRDAGGGIVAALHNEMFFVLSVYLTLHGHQVASVAGMKTAGVPLGAGDELFSGYPEWFGDLVDSAAGDARAQLLERLRAGRVVLTLFDVPRQRETDGKEEPTRQFLGRTIRCFYGPAWLATQAHCPVFFAATYREGARIGLLKPQAIVCDQELSSREQTAAITEELYTLGETCIREHPEAWTCWSYLDAFDVKRVVVHA